MFIAGKITLIFTCLTLVCKQESPSNLKCITAWVCNSSFHIKKCILDNLTSSNYKQKTQQGRSYRALECPKNPSFVSLFFVTPITCHMSIIQLNPVLSLVHLNQVARMLILLYDFTPKTARSFRLTPAALRLELRTIPDCSKNSKTF